MRAVEGNLGHSLQHCVGGGEGRERKGGLAIPCARATRGLRRPSLDARTTGKCQTAFPQSKDRPKLSGVISLPDAATPSAVLIYPPFERRTLANCRTSFTRDFLC